MAISASFGGITWREMCTTDIQKKCSKCLHPIKPHHGANERGAKMKGGPLRHKAQSQGGRGEEKKRENGRSEKSERRSENKERRAKMQEIEWDEMNGEAVIRTTKP